MTKEERIKAAFKEGQEESRRLHAEIYPDFSPPKYEDLTHFRLELAENKDVLECYEYSVDSFKKAFRGKIFEPGVYHLYFHIEKESEYDSSDEAKEKRARAEQCQKDFHEKIQAKIKEIEASND